MRLLKILLCTSFLLPFFCTAAPEKPGVAWFHSDFPPITILNGPFREQGVADRWGAFLIQQMPDYEHELITANVARLQEEMKHRPNACNRAFIKTPEREKLFLFSEPLAYFLPNGFITLRHRSADLEGFLNSRGELHLPELMAAGKFQLAVAAGRAFGPGIDPALQASTGRITQFNASDLFSTGLLQLSNAQGVDAVLGYAIELAWATRRLDLQPGKFLFVPVEGNTDLIPVHIACSRGPAGEEIIRQVNMLIRSGKTGEAAAQAYRDWLPADIAVYYERLRKRPQAAGARHKR